MDLGLRILLFWRSKNFLVSFSIRVIVLNKNHLVIGSRYNACVYYFLASIIYVEIAGLCRKSLIAMIDVALTKGRFGT